MLFSMRWSIALLPDPAFFGPLYNYESFFKQEYRAPSFQVIKFLETENVTQSVKQDIVDKPVCELTISGSGPLLKAIGLGIMLSFVLAAGTVPTEMGSIYS